MIDHYINIILYIHDITKILKLPNFFLLFLKKMSYICNSLKINHLNLGDTMPPVYVDLPPLIVLFILSEIN